VSDAGLVLHIIHSRWQRVLHGHLEGDGDRVAASDNGSDVHLDVCVSWGVAGDNRAACGGDRTHHQTGVCPRSIIKDHTGGVAVAGVGHHQRVQEHITRRNITIGVCVSIQAVHLGKGKGRRCIQRVCIGCVVIGQVRVRPVGVVICHAGGIDHLCLSGIHRAVEGDLERHR